MLKTAIILYIVCGLVWTVWITHYYFTINETITDYIEALPGNAKLVVIASAFIVILLVTTTAWPFEVTTTIPKAIKAYKK
jgi:hypothetical protein